MQNTLDNADPESFKVRFSGWDRWSAKSFGGEGFIKQFQNLYERSQVYLPRQFLFKSIVRGISDQCQVTVWIFTWESGWRYSGIFSIPPDKQ